MSQEEQDKLAVLRECGILSLRGGSITIHFDETGKIRRIESDRVLYTEKVGFTNK